jgi:hypothetical protein
MRLDQALQLLPHKPPTSFQVGSVLPALAPLLQQAAAAQCTPATCAAHSTSRTHAFKHVYSCSLDRCWCGPWPSASPTTACHTCHLPLAWPSRLQAAASRPPRRAVPRGGPAALLPAAVTLASLWQ